MHAQQLYSSSTACLCIHVPGFLVSCSYNTLCLRWEGQQCLTFDLPREHENVSTESANVSDDILRHDLRPPALVASVCHYGEHQLGGRRRERRGGEGRGGEGRGGKGRGGRGGKRGERRERGERGRKSHSRIVIWQCCVFQLTVSTMELSWSSGRWDTSPNITRVLSVSFLTASAFLLTKYTA